MLKGDFRESPGIEVFYKSRTQTVDFKEGRTVAVKVLEGKRLQTYSFYLQDQRVETKEYLFVNAKNKQRRL